MIKILVLEDDKEINQLICKVLEDNNYFTTSAFTGLDGIRYLKSEKFDLVLLDLMLPFMSGDKILSELRTFSQVPVLVISAKETTQIKVDLLRLGADDYITKPFDLDEIVARVESNLRRSRNENKEEQKCILKNKDIEMNLLEKEVKVGGKVLQLTATEYKILELFLCNPQKLFSKANLFESIWNEDYIVSDNTINVYVSRLRQKLKVANPHMEYIETLWGLGYRLSK
ncbi:response regulator transcription factor [Clostridium sp. HBUAS56017]|uniref:response regulator transcription factor n=1 Tax=Clostridium sp. HBUAS56017 TaxID=2571128 RepID=UPI001177EE83|nr:response regulator transcription factor [Clostridium sp. HBUAS56017]